MLSTCNVAPNSCYLSDVLSHINPLFIYELFNATRCRVPFVCGAGFILHAPNKQEFWYIYTPYHLLYFDYELEAIYVKIACLGLGAYVLGPSPLS